MLQTIEAIYDPEQGLLFSEQVSIDHRVKVLVTIMSDAPTKNPIKGSAQALLAAINAHPLTAVENYSDTQIEAQVQEARDIYRSSRSSVGMPPVML